MNQLIKITDLRDPRLDIYARLSEVQLLRYAEPAPGIFISISLTNWTIPFSNDMIERIGGECL